MWQSLTRHATDIWALWNTSNGWHWSCWHSVVITNDGLVGLTHWGRVTHICVSKLTTIGSDNGLSPGRRQAIIWTNAGILLIGTLGTNFTEILSEIHAFSFKKIHLKMSMAANLSRPQYVKQVLFNLEWPIHDVVTNRECQTMICRSYRSRLIGDISAIWRHPLKLKSHHTDWSALI